MDYCSDQCIRRTLYAVMIGVSPVILCLLLIGIARLILHCLEMSYNRRQKIPDRRRRSLAAFHHVGRPTLSYTPVSLTELHRIIQGEYHSQQQSDSSSSSVINTNESSPGTSHLMKAILNRQNSSSNTLANLVICRSAINSTPFTALLIPPSTSEMNNEQNPRRASIVTIKRESIETTTLAAAMNNYHQNTINDSSDSEQTECESLTRSPKTTTTTMTTTTVVVEEYLDFHSAHSIPYELNLVNSRFENDI